MTSRDPIPATFNPRARKIIVLLLLVVGLQFSLIAGHQSWPPSWKLLLAIAVAALAACIAPVARPIARALDRIRHPSARSRLFAALIIAILAAVGLYLEALDQHRVLIPKYQDEFSYLIQSRMIAHGKLWTASPALADFFESFQILTKPAYASVYFPGTAMMLAPDDWLGLPFWFMPLVVSGLTAGVLYWIVTDLIDGVAGLLAAILLISLPTFRLVSMMALAQAPMLLTGLLSIASYLRWRQTRSWKWAAAIGFFAGWCAIIRPIDALCFAIPIGIAMLGTIRLTNMLAILIGAAPFLAMQLIFNIGVTGSFLRTPFGFYAAQTFPQTEYGFHGFDPSIRPNSKLPQKQKFYDEHAIPFLRDHTPAKKAALWWKKYLPQTLNDATPHVLLLILLPVGLLGLTTRARWIVFAGFPFFAGLYFPYVFFLEHYTLVAAPAIILLTLLGANAVETSFPAARRWLAVYFFGAIVVLGCSTLRVFDRTSMDDFFGTMGADAEYQQIDRAIAAIQQSPNVTRAIVLFRFGKDSTAHIEPVYNIDVVNPDDARVIRAHDLGARNIELFDYYAAKQPDRAVYLFDREDGSLHFLGPVTSLVRDRANDRYNLKP